MSSQLIFQIQSTIILILMYVGVSVRKQRTKHVKIMGTVIAWDILLVLQIELTRSAIEKASHAMTNSALLNFHVTIAVLTVVLYFAMLWSGRKMLKNEFGVRKLHKFMGISTVILRTMVYVTSYMVVTNE